MISVLGKSGDLSTELFESFNAKRFLISDPDARLRSPDNLIAYAKYSVGDVVPPGAQVGHFKRIPQGTEVRIREIRILPTGSQSSTIFGRAMSLDGVTEIGWTSTKNLRGQFVNESLGLVRSEPGSSRFGPNAAWSRGEYLGQIDLVEIVDSHYAVKRIAASTIEPYFQMTTAAVQDGVTIAINSGFRSYPEQEYLWDGFNRGLPGFNKAAKPGFSNHQSGIAFDIAVAGGSGNPTYDWLKIHATSFGFVRTVSGEPWHWEFDPEKASRAKTSGTYKAPNVVN